MSLKEINALVEKDLAQTNRKINKQSRLEVIDGAIETVSSEKVFDINNNELTFIKSLNCLNNDELSFLAQMVNMPSEIKDRLKSDNIMNILPLIPVIINKLEHAKTKIKEAMQLSGDVESLNNRLDSLKILLSKLNKNDINLITDSEIDLMTSIFDENKLSFEEQIDAFKIINQLNCQIFNNYDIQLDNSNLDDEELIDIDQLDETNIEYVALENLFKKYSINWEKNYAEDVELKPNEDIKDNSTYKKRMQAIKECKAKLLKYGHLGKIDELLEYLKVKKLSFVFSQPEILTKTLLSSSKEKIVKLYDEFGANNLNFGDFVRKNPEALYPNSKMVLKINTKNTSTNNNASGGISGALNYCLKNIEFLKEHGFEVEKVFKDCESFFIHKPSTHERVYERLCLYGLNLKKSDGSTKKGFSCLGTLDVLDKVDVGIECGCYVYYLDNMSKLVNSKFNVYRIKMAKMDGVPDKSLFKQVNSSSGGTKIVLSVDSDIDIDAKYGKTKEESYAIYNAIDIPIDNAELYDDVVANAYNDTISNFVLQDEIIKQLDQLYEENKLTYNFNGVIISRFKTLRYYQTLITNPNINSSRDALMYALTKNSMLNQNDYNNICTCLDKISFKSQAIKVKGEKR